MHVRVAVTARVADDDGLGPVDVFEILGEAKQDGLHSTFGLQAVLFGACHVGASGVERELRCKEQEHAAHGGVAELRDGRTTAEELEKVGARGDEERHGDVVITMGAGSRRPR